MHPLSHHHHFALIQALGMKRASEGPEEKRPAAVQRQAQKFLSFWRKTGLAHFREEEEVLLPAYARHTRVDRDPEATRVLADHAEIRFLAREFESCLASNQPIPTEKMAHLAKLLHDHVRLEEKVLFPRIEKVLGEESLNEMGRGLTRLHSRHDVCEI